MYHRMGEGIAASGFYRRLPIALAVLHFLIFLFVLIATPVDVFKARRASGLTGCASLFGWKRCGAHSVTSSFKCGIKSAMGGAAAFAIISIFVTLTAFTLLLLSALNMWKKPVTVLIVDGVAFLTILISWACVAGAYNQGKCAFLPLGNVHVNYEYAGSFGLMVTAWVMLIIALTGLLFLPL